MSEAYLVAAARTAGGKRKGRLSQWHPGDLAAQVLNALVARAGIEPVLVEDVIMGCVSQAGEQSLNIARQAVLTSVLPRSVPATTIDRQCGSSQQAIHFAAATVMSGQMDIVIAAGIESMTRVPMGLPTTLAESNGFGNPISAQLKQSYPDGFSQFIGAEMIARKYDYSIDQLSEFAYHSHLRAIAAVEAQAFDAEIVPVEITLPGGTEQHVRDEGIRFDVTLDGIRSVKLIQEGGRISAATASQICDGAAGVMIASAKAVQQHGLKPLARIHSMTMTAGDPVIMLEEPLFATDKALKRAGMSINDIDLFEVNEAFAPVPLAWLRHTGADPAKLNVNGGAIALGHPLGASGAKLMTTLVHALRARKKRYGLQTMCEGGGMANVTIIEALQ